MPITPEMIQRRMDKQRAAEHANRLAYVLSEVYTNLPREKLVKRLRREADKIEAEMATELRDAERAREQDQDHSVLEDV